MDAVTIQDALSSAWQAAKTASLLLLIEEVPSGKVTLAMGNYHF